MVTPTIGLVAVVLALGVFAWVGFRTRGGLDDLDGYLIARGTQRAGTLGLSFLASGLGAWILFAPPEVGAFVGLVAAGGYALGAAAPVVAFALLGPRIRRVVPAGHSLTEFVRLRFGRVFHSYVVFVSILYMLVFVTAELTAIGAVAGIVAGIDARVAVVVLAAVTLAYTAYGGLRASLRTDRWQAWLLVTLLVAGTVAMFAHLGDPVGTIAASGLVGVDRLGVEVAFTLVIAVLVANLFHQGYWQRVWSARDDRTLVVGAGIGIALIVPVVALVGVVGIAASGAGLELGSPPVPFFALLVGLPPWVGVAVLVLGVSLVASSVDTLENGLASLVVAERPSLSLRDARIVTVVLVVPAVVVALQGLSVLRLFLIADLLAATIAAPAVLGLWRRATAAGALAGAGAGVAGAIVPGWVTTGSLVTGARLATFPEAVPTLPPFLWAVVASTATALAVAIVQGRETDLEELNARVPQLSPAGAASD